MSKKQKSCIQCTLLISSLRSGAYAGGGGGWGSTPPPPPPLAMYFFFFLFFFACHPGGRSGRRTVPLPNNVNDVKNCKGEKKCVGVPPPPPPPPSSATFSGLARHRGICSQKHPPLKNPAYASVYGPYKSSALEHWSHWLFANKHKWYSWNKFQV